MSVETHLAAQVVVSGSLNHYFPNDQVILFLYFKCKFA